MNVKRLMLRLLLIAAASWGTVLGVNAQTVTKSFKDQPLKSVLKEVELQTGLSVIYNSDNLSENRLVTADFNKTPVEDVLARVLDNRFDFSIVNKMIVIYERKETATGQTAEKGRVTGTVKDSEGVPLVGATVVVKRTGKGTATDATGKFVLTGVNPADELEVVYLGYELQAQTVGNRSELSFTLSEDTQQIEELVVVGYGVQKRSDITGSVASVKASELVSAPSFSASQALQGRVAGVTVLNTSGSPGAVPLIRIRGANSLQYGNSPLVIIDGVQGGDINTVNPNQIESIEVLKDAAALSIYGSKGANGVILISTKAGKGERAQIAYNGFVSVDQVSKILPTLEAWEYASLFDEFQTSLGNPAHFGQDAISQMGKGTNWQDEIFRTAISQNHSLSIGGSRDIFSYYIAAGVVLKQGIIDNTSNDLYTIRGNFKAKATKRLDITMNVSANYNQAETGASTIDGALQWAPTKPIYEDDGSYSQPESGGVGPVQIYNPVGSNKEAVNESYSGSFYASLKGDYDLWTNYLKVSSQLVYTSGAYTRGYFDNQAVKAGVQASEIGGSKRIDNNYGLQNTNILSFDHTWDRHHVQATAVYEISKGMGHQLGADSKGIPVGMGYYGLAFGTTFYPPWTTYSAYASQSAMGRVNYGYDNKYLFSASVRHDGASQLADGNKYDTFWAVSGGWNLMSEKFMEGIKPVLSEFKLRASYGTVGNAAVPAYSSLQLFSAGLDANNEPDIKLTQAGNKDLKWEKTREINVGIDASLWSGKLTATIEYYDKKTTDLIMWQQVPAVAIVKQVLRNVGSVSNKGWEFSIGGTPYSNRDFSWTANYTLNLNRNKVLALDAINKNMLLDTTLDYPGVTGAHGQIVGQPMSTFRGFIFAGTWKTEEASTAAMYGCKPGDAKYVDVNRDGKYGDDDIVILGNAQPKGVYGLNNTFHYKSLDLNIFFQGVWGNKIYNLNRVRREAFNQGPFPTNPVIRNHWTPANQTELPSFTGQEKLNSTRWMENGSYFRLKNISLGYRLPEKWMTKIGVTSLRVYVSGNNLWTATNYSGYDPEASSDKDAMGGVDYGVYPSVRSFVFGIDFNF